MTVRNDKPVMVCAECLTAACWYGQIMCGDARNAGAVVKTAGELRRLGREHEDYWTDAMFARIYGTAKPDFAAAHTGDIGETR